MRHLLRLRGVLLFLIILALGSLNAPRVEAQMAGAEQDVRDAINKLTETYGANDIDGYFSLYAPDLTWWGPSGRSDRESYRKRWTAAVERTGGLESAETSDLRIQVSPGGDLAVASYLLTVTNRNPGENRPEGATYQMSPTLIKRDGSWTIVHLHFQVVPPDRVPAG